MDRGPRHTRPWAVTKYAARVKPNDVVHLTSFAGDVVSRELADPSEAYPDGRVVLVLDDRAGSRVPFSFRPLQEVTVCGRQELDGYETWLEGGLSVRDTLTEAPQSAAQRRGQLF